MGMADNALYALIEEIREQTEPLKERICSGACKDQSDYRYWTGILYGLEQAVELAKDLNRRIEES